jgi:hypothetical protein
MISRHLAPLAAVDTMQGCLHQCEPEDFNWDRDDWAGNLWEPDMYDEGDYPSIGDFLDSLVAINPSLRDNIAGVKDSWLAAGSPLATEDARSIDRAVEIALAGGHDVYDSDTRTWVFPLGERIVCSAECATECTRGRASDVRAFIVTTRETRTYLVEASSARAARVAVEQGDVAHEVFGSLEVVDVTEQGRDEHR